MLRLTRSFIKPTLNGPGPIVVGCLVLILAYQNFSTYEPATNPINRNKILLQRLSPQPASETHSNDKRTTESGLLEGHSGDTDSYKNLQSSDLLSLHALPRSDRLDHFDIREYAPNRPRNIPANEEILRAPEVHSHRLSDVGTVLLEREVRPLMKPLEDEWLIQVNSRLRTLFGAFKPVDGEDWPETSDDDGTSKQRGPASEPGAFPGMPMIPGIPDFPEAPTSEDATDDYFSLKTITPEEVKLTKANEVTFGFKRGTLLSCELGSGHSKFRLSRPVSRTSSLDLSYESAENRNSVGFRLSW